MAETILPEERHQRLERWFWAASIAVAFLGWVGAFVAAYAAFQSYYEAHRQADTAIKQLQDTEEPSINMIGFKAALIHEAGNLGQIQIDPIFKNSGSSPAGDIRVRAQSQLCASIPGGFFPSINADTDDVPASLGGMETTSNISRHQFTVEQIRKIRDGSVRAFLYGTITYRELRSNGHHITRYCYVLTGLPPNRKLETKDSLTDIYRCGSTSNCTDDDCEYTPKISLNCNQN